MNLSLPKISSACRYCARKLIEATVRQQRRNSLLDRKEGVQQRKIRSRLATEIALLYRTSGSHRRRGPTNTKRRDVGIGDEVLRPEESTRCAHVLASKRLSIPAHLWPMPDEFGSAGSKQSNFLEFDTRIVDSKR